MRRDKSVATSVRLPADVCKVKESVGAGNGSLPTSRPIVATTKGYYLGLLSVNTASGICRSFRKIPIQVAQSNWIRENTGADKYRKREKCRE